MENENRGHSQNGRSKNQDEKVDCSSVCMVTGFDQLNLNEDFILGTAVLKSTRVVDRNSMKL